ncbi:MAG: serine/threonine-protein kinase [Jatrophihabitans sp.]
MTQPDALISGRYRLVKRIAAGGMGSVWEAWDETLHRRVALKQLHPQPGLSAADAELVTRRAMREARITARLHHAHAVPVYDVVDYEGLPCLIMQYLPSKSLHALIAEHGVLDVREVARVGGELAAALSAAHRAGIVHRDVKPGNVLIDEDGAAKLTDFGISHALGDASLTSTGMVTGTPAFLAPEVARGDDSSAASDVFSLGATLYAALEGSPPFGTETNPMAMLHSVASGRIIPPRRSGALTPVLTRMLAAAPADRPTMDEVAGPLAAVHAAPADPAAAATTEQIATPVAVPPTTTVTLPASGDAPPPHRPQRRRRTGAIIAVVAAVVILAALGTVLATQLGGSNGGQQAATSHSPSVSSSPISRTPTNRSTSPTSRQPSSSSGSSTAPSTSASASSSATGPLTASDLTQALDNYYALLPGNTDAAWMSLTATYRTSTSGSKADYQTFWSAIRKVTTAKVVANPPGSVEATITYFYNDGRVVDEDTSFGLVKQGGIVKIDSSKVISSTTR